LRKQLYSLCKLKLNTSYQGYEISKESDANILSHLRSSARQLSSIVLISSRDAVRVVGLVGLLHLALANAFLKFRNLQLTTRTLQSQHKPFDPDDTCDAARAASPLTLVSTSSSAIGVANAGSLHPASRSSRVLPGGQPRKCSPFRSAGTFHEHAVVVVEMFSSTPSHCTCPRGSQPTTWLRQRYGGDVKNSSNNQHKHSIFVGADSGPSEAVSSPRHSH